MARSDDDAPDEKAPSGAKKKRAPSPKAVPKAKKAAEGEKAPRRPAAAPRGTRKAATRAVPPKAAPPARPAGSAKPAPVAKPAPAAKRAPAPKPAAPRRARRGRTAAPAAAVPEPAVVPAPLAEVSEEERIEEAKYQPREPAPRAFEEERFLFPETYGENRVRLLVKDPEWLFAHWDVAPGSFEGLRGQVGERAAALSRLTLRIHDPHQGGTSVILLPEGVRSWYVKADRSPRAYRADLGFTLPSGEFRLLAESNTVRTPWAGSSRDRALRRLRFDGVPTPWPGEAAAEQSPAFPAARQGATGPWTPEPATQIAGRPVADSRADAPEPSRPEPSPGPGGASDVHRR
jgi:hypothetical protein